MPDIAEQMGGACCRTGAWEIRLFWLTLGENADFRMSSKVGQFIGRNEKGLDKKKAGQVAKTLAEEFPAFKSLTVVPRTTYGEAAWLRG